MKVVILAGGFGTRISEESQFKPKPMIEIGGMPILWHIMKLYNYYGYNEFIICAGYKQEVIKKWFSDYFIYTSDVTFDFTQKDNQVIVHNKHSESWKVTVVDTGLNTATGGRLKRIREYLGEETFFMTYGDGVSDVNISELLKFHRMHNKLATITSIHPSGRYGIIDFKDDEVLSFREKSRLDVGWINAGFMVLEPRCLDYIDTDDEMFEQKPMEMIAGDHQMVCYKHNGFWQCMDTLRDKNGLDEMWNSGKALWKVW